MNLAVGIAESYAEAVPVLAMVGQISSTLEGARALPGLVRDRADGQRPPEVALDNEVCRMNRRRRFWEKLAGAVQAALGGRPGPAVLLVTRDA